MEAPDGRKVDDPSGPPGRFQPGPVASADPSPPGFRPLRGTCPGPPRRRHWRPPTSASRSTAPVARFGRRPDVLPRDRARTSMPTVRTRPRMWRW